LNEAKGNLEERENQAVLDRIEAEQYQYEDYREGEEDNGEESESEFTQQPSGILTVPPTKSKWAVYLED